MLKQVQTRINQYTDNQLYTTNKKAEKNYKNFSQLSIFYSFAVPNKSNA